MGVYLLSEEKREGRKKKNEEREREYQPRRTTIDPLRTRGARTVITAEKKGEPMVLQKRSLKFRPDQ